MRSRRVQLDREVAAVAASVAHSVRSGLVLVAALGEAGRVVASERTGLAADLVRIERAVRCGGLLAEELDRWSRDRADRSVDLFVSACRFGHAEGGDLASALDGAAVALLDGVEVADEARALSTQARSSATVLVLLPLLGAAGFSALDPAVATTLVGTGVGRLCLSVGLALDAAGAWAMSGMVRRALR